MTNSLPEKTNSNPETSLARTDMVSQSVTLVEPSSVPFTDMQDQHSVDLARAVLGGVVSKMDSVERNVLAKVGRSETNVVGCLTQYATDLTGKVTELRVELEDEKQRNCHQTEMLEYLKSQEEQKQNALDRKLKLKELNKLKRRKPVRDAATYPEFQAAIEHINQSTKYRSEFVRKRDRVGCLILLLTGLRVSNLLEITAGNLRTLLEPEPTVFMVNAIKSKNRLIHRTLLTSHSLRLAQEFKQDLLDLIGTKQPQEHVFTVCKGNKLVGREELTKHLNKILQETGKQNGKTLTSHSFRIGHVSSLIQVFGLHKAQQIVGHKNAETTTKYARLPLGDEEIQLGMKKVDKFKQKRLPRHKAVAHAKWC